jgi:hypothetical protein
MDVLEEDQETHMASQRHIQQALQYHQQATIHLISAVLLTPL